jgi:surfeit locus 1 family protein
MRATSGVRRGVPVTSRHYLQDVTRTRIVFLGIVALVIAGVCIRLGIWQLDRLDQRRAENARVAAGLTGNPVELEDVGIDSTRSRALRVRLRGEYDFDNEIVLVNRSREGAPGVNLLTPLRLEGRDTAVLVNRGWVYSPDGATVDPPRWREPAGARGTAWVSWLGAHEGSESALPAESPSARAARRVTRAERSFVARLLPYPVAPYQLILLDSGATVAGASDERARAAPLGTGEAIDQTRPVRLPLPSLDEGPHRSYAIQWFSFAAIALIGTGAVVWKEWSRA